MKRKELIIDAKEAAASIEDGMTVSIGGFLLSSHPMSLIREVIKRGVKNLTLMPSVSSSVEADILIGAGCVRKIITAYCGVEEYAPICPLFRAFAEQGKLEVWEVDESHYYSVRPDVTLLYAAFSDPYGNVQPLGTGFGDRMHWPACQKLFVQVERIISNEEVRKFPERTAYFDVDGVVRAPYGAHPFAGPGFYIEDGDHIREYLAAAETFAKEGDRSQYDAYLKKYVYEPDTYVDYLERIGVRRLLSLHEDINGQD
jgi:glutaconate CoA-transferase subunit A